jgi:hypothetical protein
VIVGTTNEWCPAALKQVLEDALDKHIESVRIEGGSLSAEFASREVPPFMIRKTKVRVPKLDKLGVEDADFINYFERLHNCNVIKVADADWDWMRTLMLHFTAAGKMKRTISRQASVLELHHGPQSSLTEVRFLKSLRLQMSYNHFYRTSDLGGVACLDYSVRVEVEPGHSVPFKKTTLQRELMCMKLPPKEDGTLGDSFIDGPHSNFTGPERGHIRILYRNTDANEAYVESFWECLAAHVYLYLCEVRHYTRRCLQVIVQDWFLPEQAMEVYDSKWDPATYSATTLQSILTATYNKDMEALGVVDIAPKLLAEMQQGSKCKQQFDTEAMQRVAEHMCFRPSDGADFLQVGSGALVLTETSHMTTGQDSIRLVTLEVVSVNLMSACQEFHGLAFALRKMCPDHDIFEETNFAENAMDTSSFGSDKSDKLQQLYQETRAKSFCLQACINKIKQSASMNGLKTGVPLPSGSAAPPPKPMGLRARREPGVGRCRDHRGR